jgi:ABC-type nitrate/sulfonate/bicarbonate transport system substrate-binding protein
MKSKWLLFSLTFFMFPLSLGHDQSKELIRLRITYSSISAASLVTWAAKDASIFQKHGLDVGLVYIGGGTMAMSTTISGETQITQGAGTGSILARLSGADTVMFATILDTPPPESDGSAGHSRASGSQRQEIRDHPLRLSDPEKDVQMIQMGGIPEILGGMQGGSIQGGALSSPALSKAKLLGYREMMDLGALGIKYPGTCYMATESYIKNQRPIVIQFLKGVIEGAHFVKNK